MNIVAFTGNLTRDAELHQAGDKAVAKFTIAVNEKKGKDKEFVSFIDCAMWGSRAESLCSYLTKGIKVGITGKLIQQRWEKDGQKHSKFEVSVNEFEFLSQKKGTESQPVSTYGTEDIQF